MHSETVQNKIDNMKLNFELLEQKLEQEGQGVGANLPDSGRVIVVSGRDPPFSLNLLS